MKGMIKLVLISSIFSLAAQTTIATNDTNMMNKSSHKLWTCQTNASSSSNQKDTNADHAMSKTAKSAKKQFSFALENCRDCTEITCTVQNK